MSLALASCPMPPARHWHSSADPGDLAGIYNPAITLAVWERQLSRHPGERSGLFQDPAAIMQIATGAAALMKGETWQDNAGRGLIHRSPWLAPDQRRLIVTLDLC